MNSFTTQSVGNAGKNTFTCRKFYLNQIDFEVATRNNLDWHDG